MSQKTVSAAIAGLILASLLVAPGCAVYGPNLGLLAYPIPVSPFFQDQLEDKFHYHERYAMVPILGPATQGEQVVALDPPSPDEVMVAMEKARGVEGGLPFLHEVQRSNVRMVIELISDYADPPRVYPLIGPAMHHHAQYKCMLYFTEVTRVGWPIPHTTTNEDAQEVVYIDHNHLHMVGNVDDAPPGPSTP